MHIIIGFCRQPVGLIIAFLVMLACMIAFQYVTAELGTHMLDIFNSYNRAMVEQKMQEYGEVGRSIYARTSITLDIIYPLAYGVFFTGLLARLAQDTQFQSLIYLPIFMVGLDMLENLQIYIMLVSYPELSDRQIILASLTTQSKWLMVRAVVVVLLLLGVVALVRRVANMFGLWHRRR